MNAADVCSAVEALNAAGKALRCGNLSLDEQMRLGLDCYQAAIKLEIALEAVEIEVP